MAGGRTISISSGLRVLIIKAQMWQSCRAEISIMLIFSWCRKNGWASPGAAGESPLNTRSHLSQSILQASWDGWSDPTGTRPRGQDKGKGCKYASKIDSWNWLLCVKNLRSKGTSGWMFCISQADIERIEAGAWSMESGDAYKRIFFKCGGLRPWNVWLCLFISYSMQQVPRRKEAKIETVLEGGKQRHRSWKA